MRIHRRLYDHQGLHEAQLQQFVYPKVLIIDEIGYLPMSRDEAGLFFRLLSRRHEKAATIITSNKSFVDWGEIFNDQVLAIAILDALLNHLKLPVNHRKRVRTSNLVERAFEETMRRTKIIARFLTEKSGLKLVYSVLRRAAVRWRRIPVTAFDLLSLDRLRETLGIKDEKVDNQYDLKEVRR